MLPSSAFRALSDRLHARSQAVLLTLENRLPRFIVGWVALAALASIARIALSPIPHLEVTAWAPYVLLVTAPVMSYLLARRWFANGDRLPQPAHRFALVGRWTKVSAADARRHKLYGTSGIMVSLLVGILLNVVVLGAEYLVILPAISATAPAWIATLHAAMTVDVVVMSSLYVVAFVAALRRVPLFPRFMLFVWLLDIVFQMMIAQTAMSASTPTEVAAALEVFLKGNVQKTLVSMVLWLPYLILSTRVNVTYRQRIPQ